MKAREESASSFLTGCLHAPKWFISSYFFFVFIIYAYFEYVTVPHVGGFLVWRDQEPMELLLSLGFLLFALINYIKSGQDIHLPGVKKHSGPDIIEKTCDNP